MATAYRAARVIDVSSEEPTDDGVVVVEDGRVASVGPARELESGVEVVDLGDVTLLPGLIDAHVHLVWSASAELHEVVERESRTLTALRCANNAKRHLRAGVTPIRDVGSTDGLAIEIGRAMQHDAKSQHVGVGGVRHRDLSVTTDCGSQIDPNRDPYEAVLNSIC